MIGSDNRALPITDKGAVFLLEDRPDVLESTEDLLRAHGLRTISAAEPQTGWETFSCHADDIRIALIDKNIGTDREAGLRFLERLREKFSEKIYYLITAWDLSPSEVTHVKEKEIDVLEKAKVSGSRLVDLCTGEEQFSEDEVFSNDADSLRESSNDVNVLETRVAEVRDELHQLNLHMRSLQLQNNDLSVAVGRFGESLIHQLQLESETTDPNTTLIDGKQMSYADVIREIREGTKIGMSLIDAHLSVFQDLIQDRTSRGWRRWLRF